MEDNISKSIVDDAFERTVTELNKAIGIRIFTLRTGLNMSRAALGERVCMHETTVKKYEDGLIKSVGIDKIALFAKALGGSVENLIDQKAEGVTSKNHHNTR